MIRAIFSYQTCLSLTAQRTLALNTKVPGCYHFAHSEKRATYLKIQNILDSHWPKLN